jgi:hypothetical protein
MENPPMGGQAPIAPRVFSCLRAAKAGGETLFLWSEYLKLNVFAFLQIKNQSICCFTVVRGLTFGAGCSSDTYTQRHNAHEVAQREIFSS